MTSKGTVTAILTSDWHVREDKPVARTDDFWETQWKKIRFITKLQARYKVPVLHAGDLFNTWKVSPYLLTTLKRFIPNDFITIYGNHDLPRHSLSDEMVVKSAVYNMIINHTVKLQEGRHYGQERDDKRQVFELGGRKILMWHVMAVDKPLPFYLEETYLPKDIVRAYPDVDLIITGHNHKTFYKQIGNQLVVNPGAIFRLRSSDVDLTPTVYLYYAQSNTVEPVIIPHEKDVITRKHLERKEEKDKRFDVFIEAMKADKNKTYTIDFVENLKRYMAENNLNSEVRQLIESYASIV